MPDRLASRAVLAVLLLLLTIAGIRAAGPAVTVATPALPVVIGIGSGLEAVLAVLLIALRWRPRTEAGPAARLRLLLTGAIVILLIAIPAAMLIAGVARLRPRRRLSRPHPRPGGHPARLHVGRLTHATAGLAYAQYILIGLLIAAAIVAAILIWRRRRWWSRTGGIPVTADDGTDTPGELARAVGGRRSRRPPDGAVLRGAVLHSSDAAVPQGRRRAGARGHGRLPDSAGGPADLRRAEPG